MKLPGLTLSKSGVLLNEPVMAAAVTLWLLANGSTWVVGRFGWMDQAAYDALSNKLVGVVSLIVVTLLGLLVRRVVTPAWKALQDHGFDLPDLQISDEEADAILAQAAPPEPGPPVEGRHRALPPGVEMYVPPDPT